MAPILNVMHVCNVLRSEENIYLYLVFYMLLITELHFE